jgi:GT2 family glycosyltransferase
MNDWYLYKFFETNNYSKALFEDIFYPDFASGAALFFSRNVFQKIGLLDEFLFWIEDTDYCYRANKVNIKTLYNPSFKIMHHIGASGKKNYKISLSNQTYNKIKFLIKNKQQGVFVLKTLTIINVVVKIVIFGIYGLRNKQAKLKAEAYIYTLPKIWNPPSGIA